MPWNDDSWKDGYDEWKLRAPDWDDDEECGYCDHDDYEVDILDGECRCHCGHIWSASEAEINAEIGRQREYSEMMDREERRQWWRDRTYPIRMFIFRILERIWPKKTGSVLDDDEIPF